MKSRYIVYSAVSLVAFAGLSVARASDSKGEISLLRGAAEVRQANGTWSAADSISVGQWVRSSKTDTTVRLPGLTMRVEPGASVRVSKVDGQNTQVDAQGGRVFLKVDSDSTCQVSMANKQVRASQSEFVLDAGPEEKLLVLDGQARFVDEKPATRSLSAWAKGALKPVALDGPDVRQRNKSRKKFVQGEENTGKRIGEDESPTTSPTPSSSPAYTPSPSPSITPPSPSPSPPSPSPSPTAQGGGGEVWPYLVGAGVVGGGLAILLNNDDDDDDVILPASP